jgi:leucyl aminopeptidase
VIDIATLTGACVIALGPFTSGLMANDDDLAAELLAAARNPATAPGAAAVGRLPGQLKSNFADMANIGGKRRPAPSPPPASWRASSPTTA